jgi:hypothetical protein
MLNFATAPGRLAREPTDPEARNGVFTAAFLEQLRARGTQVDAGKLLRYVGEAVLRATDGKQRPWTHSTLPPEDVHVLPPSTTPTLAECSEAAVGGFLAALHAGPVSPAQQLEALASVVQMVNPSDPGPGVVQGRCRTLVPCLPWLASLVSDDRLSYTASKAIRRICSKGRDASGELPLSVTPAAAVSVLRSLCLPDSNRVSTEEKKPPATCIQNRSIRSCTGSPCVQIRAPRPVRMVLCACIPVHGGCCVPLRVGRRKRECCVCGGEGEGLVWSGLTYARSEVDRWCWWCDAAAQGSHPSPDPGSPGRSPDRCNGGTEGP